MRGMVTRRRYHVFVSVMYMLAGAIIVFRAAVAAVWPMVILGIVFLALGAVRLRDYYAWKRGLQ